MKLLNLVACLGALDTGLHRRYPDSARRFRGCLAHRSGAKCRQQLDP